MLVGYLRHAVELPQCGKVWPNLARSWKNEPAANFGCAVNSNLAAMVADP